MQIQTWAWKCDENISKTKEKRRASFASYCFQKIDNKGQRAIKTKECERQNGSKWRTRQGKKEEIYLGDKRMWARNRFAEQKAAGGKGLDLVYGTKGSQSEDREPRRKTKQRRPGTGARNKKSQAEDKERSPGIQKKFSCSRKPAQKGLALVICRPKNVRRN